MGGLQQEKVSRKQGRLILRYTVHHPLPLWCWRQVKGQVFSRVLCWAWDLLSMENSQIDQSSRGPLLAAGSRLCPSITPILLIWLCQGGVCSPITWIWTAQIGWVRGQGGGPGCSPVWRGYRQAQLLWMAVHSYPERRAGQGHTQGFRELRDVSGQGNRSGEKGGHLSRVRKGPGLGLPAPSTPLLSYVLESTQELRLCLTVSWADAGKSLSLPRKDSVLAVRRTPPFLSF